MSNKIKIQGAYVNHSFRSLGLGRLFVADDVLLIKTATPAPMGYGSGVSLGTGHTVVVPEGQVVRVFEVMGVTA